MSLTVTNDVTLSKLLPTFLKQHGTGHCVTPKQI